MPAVARRTWIPTLALALAACGGDPGVVAVPGAGVAPPAQSSAPARPVPKSRTDLVANAKAFDANGTAATCAPPIADCPPLPVERTFLDNCRLAGFRVVQCGCAARCAGDVTPMTRRWDASGNMKTCAPAVADCTPPPASAAFQDACNEKGYRLDTCGCEWLCSGNPTR